MLTHSLPKSRRRRQSSTHLIRIVLLTVLLVSLVLGVPLANATVSNVDITSPVEELDVGVPEAKFSMTFTTSASHAYGDYRAIVWLQGPATVQLGVRRVPLPITGGNPSGPVIQTEEFSIPEGTAPGLYDLCVRAEENYPPGSESWGYSQTDCSLKMIKVGGLKIESVEFTQVIQELQSLDDLKTNGPKVPIVKGKPAVMRIYFSKVGKVTPVKVAVSGTISGEQTLTLQPQCTPELYRRAEQGCLSANFYFTPPAGVWNVTAKLFDKDGKETNSHDFAVMSRTVNPLVLRPVSVCDEQTAILFFFNKRWNCSSGSNVAALVPFLRKIAPTDQVSVAGVVPTVRSRTSDFSSKNNYRAWWVDITVKINALWSPTQTGYYYGMVRANVPGGISGRAAGIPGRGGASRESVRPFAAFGNNVELSHETLAHEVGHMLSLQHTNLGDPQATTPPGCYGTAQASATSWPYTDNTIQDVGFDVAARRVVLPDTTYDVMSYCSPRWISPDYYRQMMDHLSSNALMAATAATSRGSFYHIVGVSTGEEPAAWALYPLVTVEAEGSPAAGSGNYKILVLDNTGNTLFTRNFTPFEINGESADPGDELDAFMFNELVPVQPRAAAISIRNAANAEIGRYALTGAAPVVTITTPTGGTLSGEQEVLWTISDSDSSTHVSQVEYSNDNGTTWTTLAFDLKENGLVLNFDALGGGTACQLRITVSDGANSNVAVSAPFSVPTKAPQATIIAPSQGTIFKQGDLVLLEANVYDLDDGTVGNVSWSSSRDGVLGSGDVLPVTTLSEGNHQITLRATDRDGNTMEATLQVVVDGTPPNVDLTLTPHLDSGRPAPTQPPNGAGVGPGNVLFLHNVAATGSIGTSMLELGINYDEQITSDFSAVEYGDYDTIVVAVDDNSLDGGTVDGDDLQVLRQQLDVGKEVFLFGSVASTEFVQGVQTHLLDVDTTLATWTKPTVPDLRLVNENDLLAVNLPITYTLQPSLEDPTRSAAEYALKVTDTRIVEVLRNGDSSPALFYLNYPNAARLTWFVNASAGVFWEDPADTALLTQITANALNTLQWRSCVMATITTTTPNDLARLEYSTDGGETWATLRSTNFLVQRLVAGEGSVHVVVRGVDAAGNVRAVDKFVHIARACAAAGELPLSPQMYLPIIQRAP